MPSQRTGERLALLAQEQWGLLTRRQAERAGVSRATLTRLSSDGSALERVAFGVYHLTGAPWPDHVELRAAWLQLVPDVPAWKRTADQGIVSYRSAAALYGIGDLPADRHEFTVESRRQTRRHDVRLHRRDLTNVEWTELQGLPVTRPSQIAVDLLSDHEDPEAVAHIVVEATRHVYDYPGTFADALGPHAARFGLPGGDGIALLRWIYDLVGDPGVTVWMDEARAHRARAMGVESPTRD